MNGGDIQPVVTETSTDDAVLCVTSVQNEQVLQKLEGVISETVDSDPQHTSELKQNPPMNIAKAEEVISEELKNETPRKKSKKHKKHKSKKKKKRKKEKKERHKSFISEGREDVESEHMLRVKSPGEHHKEIQEQHKAINISVDPQSSDLKTSKLVAHGENVVVSTIITTNQESPPEALSLVFGPHNLSIKETILSVEQPNETNLSLQEPFPAMKLEIEAEPTVPSANAQNNATEWTISKNLNYDQTVSEHIHSEKSVVKSADSEQLFKNESNLKDDPNRYSDLAVLKSSVSKLPLTESSVFELTWKHTDTDLTVQKQRDSDLVSVKSTAFSQLPVQNANSNLTAAVKFDSATLVASLELDQPIAKDVDSDKSEMKHAASEQPAVASASEQPAVASAPELPAPAPELPAPAPELPAPAPELPALAPELPALAPELPALAPELPALAPELPAPAPELPAAAPELPAPAPAPELPPPAPELPAPAPAPELPAPELPAPAPELPAPAPELPAPAPEHPAVTSELPAVASASHQPAVAAASGQPLVPVAAEQPLDASNLDYERIVVGHIEAKLIAVRNERSEPTADGAPKCEDLLNGKASTENSKKGKSKKETEKADKKERDDRKIKRSRSRSLSKSKKQKQSSGSHSTTRHSPSKKTVSKSKKHSDSKKKRSRSRSRHKSRSRSTEKRKDAQSPPKSRSRHSRSRSPRRTTKLYSRSRRSRSKSPLRKRKSRSKSAQRSRSRSRSRHRRKTRSRSKSNQRSRSRSHSRHRRKTRSRSRSRRRRSPSRDRSKWSPVNQSRVNDRRRKRSNSRDGHSTSLKSRLRSRSPARRRRSSSTGRGICKSPVRRRRSRSPVRRSRSPVRRSRSPVRKKSFSRSPERRNRSRSMEKIVGPSRSPQKRLTETEKAQLLQIAKANAAAMCVKTGIPLPQNLKLATTTIEDKISQRSGGTTMQELMDKCKQIAQSKEDDEVVNKPHVSDDEEEARPFFNHPFKVNEHKAISFSLNNPSVKAAPKNQVTLTKEFPVSSGSQHRKKEVDKVYGQWVPVKKNKEESKDDVFNSTGQPQPVDITSAMNERAFAQKRLAENPYELEALCLLTRAQQQIDRWAQVNSLPGQFTGSTGAQVLSSEELCNSGPQAWLKKDQFLKAAPVSGGMGAHLMRRMGWREGDGLGKNKEGTVEPILVDFKTDRKGLVAEGEKTLKKSANLSALKDLSGKHPVSALMELCNKKKLSPPEFVLVHDSGPDHLKVFLYKVMVNGKECLPSQASPNKKHAKAMAATAALQAMGLVPKENMENATAFASATES
ncbi:protein SON isoform X2 [Ambystoma mexicanum]